MTRPMIELEFNLLLSPFLDVRAPAAIQLVGALARSAEQWAHPEWPIPLGTRVKKIDGDYEWEGDIRCCYQKRNGIWRVVSENDQRLNHIFSAKQLEAIDGVG